MIMSRLVVEIDNKTPVPFADLDNQPIFKGAGALFYRSIYEQETMDQVEMRDSWT